MTKTRWQCLRALFEQALDLHASARIAFLRTACGSDTNLLEDLLGLLAEEAQSGILDRHLYNFSPADIVGGRFKIVRIIGYGGMGTVYEAEDLWLPQNPPVALKTVRFGIGISKQMQQQLENEVCLARAITHRNICRIHDMGRHAIPGSQTHVVFFTMELIPGHTLLQHIQNGPFREAQALRIIRQITSALETAHNMGVVHRDLKSSNVILKPGEKAGEFEAVVTDFGLALETTRFGDTPAPLTFCRLGTPNYMSPELLAEALQMESPYPTDPKTASDIYSLGILIYEVLTGDRPLAGVDICEAARKRIAGEIASVRELRPDLDSRWDVVIRGCLEPSPSKRFASASDVLRVFEETEPRYWLRGHLAIFASILLTALAVVFSLLMRPTAPQFRLTRLTSDFGLAIDPVLSPNGNVLLYASDRASRGPLNLWAKDLSSNQLRQLTHFSESAHEPDFSPDARQIAFRSENGSGGIYVVPFGGGEPKLLADNGRYPRYSPRGDLIAFCAGEGTLSRLYVMKASGGVPKEIAQNFEIVRFPAWLPDNKHILFWGVQTGKVLSDWWVVDVAKDVSVATRALYLFRKLHLSVPDTIPSASFFRPANWNDGHIVFSAAATESDGMNLWQVNLSRKTWKPLGSAVRLTTGTDLEVAPYAVSDKKIVFASLASTTRLAALELGSGPTSGKNTAQVFNKPTGVRLPTISRDGKFIAYSSNRSGTHEIRLAKANGNDEGELIATTPNDDSFPVISPEGSMVAYSVVQRNNVGIYIADGKKAVKRVCDHCGRLTLPRFQYQLAAESFHHTQSDSQRPFALL